MRWAILACVTMLTLSVARSVAAQDSAAPTGPQACAWASGTIPNFPPPQRIIVSANMAARALKHQPQPQYPPEARRAGIEGTVTLCAIIARDGTIDRLQYVSGPAALMKAALDAAKQWHYEPTLLNGKSVEVETRIYVRFRLKDQGRKNSPAASQN